MVGGIIFNNRIILIRNGVGKGVIHASNRRSDKNVSKPESCISVVELLEFVY